MELVTQYNELAKELNLQLEYREQKTMGILIGTVPMLYGQLGGRNLEIRSKIISSKSTDPIVENIIKIGCHLPKDTNLIIYRQGLGDELKAMLGMQDLQFEDKGFDDNFVIKSNRAKFARQVLSPQLRNLFVRDMGLLTSFKIGPSFWELQLPENPFKNRNKEVPSDILDFPQEKETDKAKKNKSIRTNTPTKNYIESIFPHNLENEMHRSWIHRVLKTNQMLANQIEKAGKELGLEFSQEEAS